MIETREFRGYWWLPESPDNKVGGIAVFNPSEGISLELLSSLNAEFGQLSRENRIYGITTEGKDVTLEDCVQNNSSMSISDGTGLTTSEYKALRAYIGSHISDEHRFDAGRIHYPILSNWVGISGVDDIQDDGQGSIEVSYDRPDAISAEISDAELSLNFSPKLSLQRVGGVSIDEKVYFRIQPKSGQLSFDELVGHGRTLQDFLTLASGKETQISDLIGIVDDEEEPGENKIEILFTTVGEVQGSGQLHSGRANFMLSDIREKFSEVMRSWFRGYEELKPVFNLYFSVQYSSEMYVQNRLLTLSRAVETYHRSRMDGQYLSEDEFEEFYQDLCDEVPDEYSESFRSHLMNGTFKYANEYSLRKRLSELTNRYIHILERLPLEIENSINLIVNTRNYFTHYDEDISPRASASGLRDLNLKLMAMLETALLSEIDIPESQIRSRLQKRYSERS